jgi:DNA topoisomerase IA
VEHAGKLIEDEELRERMTASGLGTCATRAAVIEAVEGGYVARRAGPFYPPRRAAALIQVAPEEITSSENTGRWEKALYDIAGQQGHGNDGRAHARFMEGIRPIARSLRRPPSARPRRTLKRK